MFCNHTLVSRADGPRHRCHHFGGHLLWSVIHCHHHSDGGHLLFLHHHRSYFYFGIVVVMMVVICCCRLSSPSFVFLSLHCDGRLGGHLLLSVNHHHHHSDGPIGGWLLLSVGVIHHYPMIISFFCMSVLVSP